MHPVSGPTSIAVGIDVSKDHLDVARSDQSRTHRLPNTPAGHRRLLAVLAPIPAALIVLEPTSRYHRALVATLTAADRPPAVVNPYQVRRFADGRGTRAKTDTTDAHVLADYGLRLQPIPRPQPTPAEATLADLVARRADLVKMRVAEQARVHLATPAERASLDRHIAFLSGEITHLETAIAQTIAADPRLVQRSALLRTVPGIGPVSAAVLLATMPELGTLTHKTAAALAGLAPVARQSGRRDRPRSISGGRAGVRTALYLVTVTAKRTTPGVAAHYAALTRTKPAKVALVACARKLLTVINAMLRDGVPWSATRLGATTA